MQNQEFQLKRLAECLGEASNLVSNLAETSNVAADGNDIKHDGDTRPRSSAGFSLGQARIYSSSSSLSNGQPPQITAANHSLSSRSTFINLGHVVNRAQGMMQQASNNGLFRRLPQSERLRAASQFRSDCEKEIRDKIAKAINKQYPILAGKDLVFLKANRRKLENVVNADNFDYKQVKLLAGQGAIYLRMQAGYDFMLGTVSLSDDDSDDLIQVKSEEDCKITNVLTSTTSENIESEKEEQVSSSPTTTKPTNPDHLLHEDIQKCVKFCKENDITDPVEILCQIQKCIVHGRPLDVVSSCSTVEGDTNCIFVNQQDILSSFYPFKMETENLQFEEKLSEAVRQFLCIYDKTKKDYKDININKNAWNNIAAQMNIENGERTRQLFENLKKRFSRRGLDLKKSERSGTSASVVQKAKENMKDYSFLAWLIPYIKL
eukprot:gene20860-22911_t